MMIFKSVEISEVDGRVVLQKNIDMVKAPRINSVAAGLICGVFVSWVRNVE